MKILSFRIENLFLWVQVWNLILPDWAWNHNPNLIIIFQFYPLHGHTLAIQNIHKNSKSKNLKSKPITKSQSISSLYFPNAEQGAPFLVAPTSPFSIRPFVLSSMHVQHCQHPHHHLSPLWSTTTTIFTTSHLREQHLEALPPPFNLSATSKSTPTHFFLVLIITQRSSLLLTPATPTVRHHVSSAFRLRWQLFPPLHSSHGASTSLDAAQATAPKLRPPLSSSSSATHLEPSSSMTTADTTTSTSSQVYSSNPQQLISTIQDSE